MDQLFSWLHISDIHFGQGDAPQAWDKRLVVSKLKSEISNLQELGYPKPDVVLVTGDVAFSGGVQIRAGASQPTEYGEAKDWLGGLLRELNLPLERAYVIPGNHDVQRDVADRKTRRLLDNLREGRDPIDSVWEDPEDESLLTRRQANYLEFATAFRPKATRLFWMEQVKARRDITVRIVGLNSALLCADNRDFGKLDIGREQLALTNLQPPVKQDELVILLTHHPLDWMRNQEAVVRTVQNRAHIHLCGHVHQAKSALITTGGGAHLVRIGAGAVHSIDAKGEARVRFGYNFGSIYAETDGAVTLQTWPRSWSDDNEDFRPDIDNVTNGQLSATHLLRFRMPKRTASLFTGESPSNWQVAQQGRTLQGERSYLAALVEAIKAITTQFDLERRQILERIIRPAMGGIRGSEGPKAILGTIQLFDEESGDLTLDSVYSLDPDQNLTDRLGERWHLRANLANRKRIGITGRTALTARAQLVSDVRGDEDYIRVGPQTLSELTVPLIDRSSGKVVGVLNVESDHLNAFDEDDQEAFQPFAELAVIAIQNSCRIETLQTRATHAFMGIEEAVRRHELAVEMGILLDKLHQLDESLTGVNASLQAPREILADIERRARSLTFDQSRDQADKALRWILVNDDLVEPFRRHFLENHPDWGQRFEILCELGASAQIRVNPAWLFWVLDILVSNSEQAGAQSIILGSRWSGKDGWAEILVSDDGPGIPENVRDRLFREPIRETSKGLGTGLLIAEAVVRIFGGHIHWEVREPRGTTMVLSLPIERPPSADSTFYQERNALVVLLATDNLAQLGLWSDVLQGAGYEVVKASSFTEAHELLIKGGLDLAVLDFHMQENGSESDSGGLRLAQIFRESVPVIMLVGTTTVSPAVAVLQREGRSSPALAIVRKQEDGPEVFLQAVRRAIMPKVIVSQGSDVNVEATVVKFLKKVGTEPVLLNEELMANRTILDVFEEYANIRFAVVLITTDDKNVEKDGDLLQSRVRQRVIFELGVLLAKLGRHRVVALCQEGLPLEWPFSYQGVLYLALDPWGDWQNKLSSAMATVGIQLP